MTRTPSTDERLARLAARGRVGQAAAASDAAPPRSSPLGPASPWGAPNPYDRAGARAASQPTVGYPPADPSAWRPAGVVAPSAARTVAPTRRTGGPGPRRVKHHPARRSRIVSAGVSTALLFGGIGYFSTSQVFASSAPSSTGQTVDDGTGVDDPTLGTVTDDPANLAPEAAEAPGTLPPTIAPTVTTSTATTAAPVVASATADPAADPAAAQAAADAAAAQAAADQAAADQAAADAAAAEQAAAEATTPPTTARRVPRTAAPRPRCTGSHC